MAVKNNSESSRTVKTMWEQMPSDNWSVDRGLTYCCYNEASIVQDDFLLDKYYSYFEQFLVEAEIDERYYYSPQLFANDYYGDPGLDYLVLYFAGMTSNFDFNKPKIKILEYSHLKELNQLYTFYRKTIDASKVSPTVYSSDNVQEIKTPAKYLQK